MLITVDEKKKFFKLDSGDSSYVMLVNDRGFLVHGYWDILPLKPVRMRRIAGYLPTLCIWNFP